MARAVDVTIEVEIKGGAAPLYAVEARAWCPEGVPGCIDAPTLALIAFSLLNRLEAGEEVVAFSVERWACTYQGTEPTLYGVKHVLSCTGVV